MVALERHDTVDQSVSSLLGLKNLDSITMMSFSVSVPRTTSHCCQRCRSVSEQTISESLIHCLWPQLEVCFEALHKSLDFPIGSWMIQCAAGVLDTVLFMSSVDTNCSPVSDIS